MHKKIGRGFCILLCVLELCGEGHRGCKDKRIHLSGPDDYRGDLRFDFAGSDHSNGNSWYAACDVWSGGIGVEAEKQGAEA